MTSSASGCEAGHVLMESEQLLNVSDFKAFKSELLRLCTRYAQVANRAPGAPMPMVASDPGAKVHVAERMP